MKQIKYVADVQRLKRIYTIRMEYSLRFSIESLEFFVKFLPHFDPGVDSPSNWIEYQGYLLGVKAASP